MSNPSQNTFNLLIGAAVVAAVVILGYTAVGQIWPRAGAGADLVDTPPETVAGPLVTPADDAAGTTDDTTLDTGRYRSPPAAQDGEGRPELEIVTLPDGASVTATPQAAALLAYLGSEAAPGRRFALESVRFVGREEVRQDPDGALTTYAAILNAYPATRVRIEVIERNPDMSHPHDRATQRAANVAAALVDSGLDAGRVTARGLKSQSADRPRVELVVAER